jgi:hypothetical protein
MMTNLEIIEREHNEVYWRYKGMDGSSAIFEGKAEDAMLADYDLMLTKEAAREVRRRVDRWLEEQA